MEVLFQWNGIIYSLCVCLRRRVESFPGASVLSYIHYSFHLIDVFTGYIWAVFAERSGRNQDNTRLFNPNLIVLLLYFSCVYRRFRRSSCRYEAPTLGTKDRYCELLLAVAETCVHVLYPDEALWESDMHVAVFSSVIHSVFGDAIQAKGCTTNGKL